MNEGALLAADYDWQEPHPFLDFSKVDLSEPDLVYRFPCGNVSVFDYNPTFREMHQPFRSPPDVVMYLEVEDRGWWKESRYDTVERMEEDLVMLFGDDLSSAGSLLEGR